MPPTLALSADELVNQLRARGIMLQINGSKLRASSRFALTDADRSLIREHKAELLALLAAPIAGDWRQNSQTTAENQGTVAVATTRPPEDDVSDSLSDWLDATIDAAFPPDGTAKAGSHNWQTRYRRESRPWSGDDAKLIGWFRSRRDWLPRGPFQLSPGINVVDPMKFYAALENDIQAGASGPRAAGLRYDLGQLWHFHNTFLMVK